METVVINITTEYERALAEAKRLINDGQVVGIPTETVYGLAANAFDEDAVKKIFVAKGRPSDNPLIVHISKFEDLEPLVSEIPEKVRIMAEKFWPAPLTMIMKKSDKISNVVSGNLPTVAVRMPENDYARAIIESCGVPLAAPSANLSGSPSPTNAKYVYNDMNGRIPLIIDGGNCEIGVESTVISFSEEPPRLLRPGGVTLEEMTELIGEIVVDDAVLNKLEEGAVASSPGMKYKHYAPSADITIIKSDFDTFKNLCEIKTNITAMVFDGEENELSCPAISYGNKNDGYSQSARLFDALRELDEIGAKKVYARCPDTKGMGLAVYNRLIRAAGFKIKVI
jgi:L-threonylcarbamoyladenylate synthase